MFIKKIFFLIILTIFTLQPLATIYAASFNPSLILSNEELTNHQAMNLDQIKDFLNKKGGILANYVEQNVKMYTYQIIYEVSQVYKINPKYVLTLLQKEQGLITNKTPSQSQLDWATGYGCPDSGGCNSKYQGLANQIDWGVGSIRYYLDHPNEFRLQVGQTATIDGQEIAIQNDATRALYIYTPHINGNKTLHTLWNDWFSMTYPEGSLLQDASDQSLWLIQNNVRRKFASKSVFTSNYSLNKVLVVKTEDLEKYAIGAPIKYANYSLLQIPTGGVYFLENEILRPITSSQAFKLIGFNPEEITKISLEELNQFSQGEPITIKSAYPVGGVLQDLTTKEIYYVKDGVKHLIGATELIKIYFPNRKIVKVKSEELTKYETGEPYKLKDGELIKVKNAPQVYVISEGKKRLIANGETFESLGYKWKNIFDVPQNILDLHPLGEDLNTVE